MSLDPCLHPDIALTLPQLLNIRHWASAHPAHAPRGGRSHSEQGKTGRSPGLTFRELRGYQAGDEVRHIDWRVTARLGRPFTRLYHEEQEQAHWLLLDLSPAMFFGSTVQLKARLGCELAAALLWQQESQPHSLLCHGLVPQLTHQRQRGSVLPLLDTLCHHYQQGLSHRPFAHTLADTLADTLASQALPHGARLTIITDHRPCAPALGQRLQHLARRHDIHYWQIRDPLEVSLPPDSVLSVTLADTARQSLGWLDGQHPRFARRYQRAASQWLAQSQQQLLPVVQRLYLLDNGQPLQQQWQGALCSPT